MEAVTELAKDTSDGGPGVIMGVPWRESEAELVTIPLTDEGALDLQALESQLQRYQGKARIVTS